MTARGPGAPLRDASAADAAALEAGRRLFAQECTFRTGAASLEGLPETELPEVAFAGRSNVGKSSLVNAMVGRHALARVSDTPGRTQQLNFFDLGGRLMLVDLPGYGYARAPQGEIDRWTGLTEDYLKGRPGLRRVCLLIDSRHGIKGADRRAMDLLDADAVSYQVVLTKCDKTKEPALAECVRAVTDELGGHVAAHPDVMATSAFTGQGIPELRAALASLARPF